jgi:uncharacterized protein YkwD
LLPVWIAAACLLATAFVLVGPATAQTAPCPVSAEDQAIDSEEQQMLALINQYRTANGKLPLALNPGVTRAAAWFSRDQASKNYLSLNHFDSNGRFVPDRLTWCGVSYTAWAENVYAGSPEAEDAFLWWQNSPPHNENLLRDTVTLAGIARAFQPGTTYGWYWTLDLTAPPATFIAGSTWYMNGTNASTGLPGSSVSVFGVAALRNVPYQMVLATSGCNTTVAVLNPSNRFANTSGFIPRTIGVIPAATPPGTYAICFKSGPELSTPTGTTPVNFTLL